MMSLVFVICHADESTRVVLTSSPENTAASYINANYIRVRLGCAVYSHDVYSTYVLFTTAVRSVGGGQVEAIGASLLLPLCAANNSSSPTSGHFLRLRNTRFV